MTDKRKVILSQFYFMPRLLPEYFRRIATDWKSQVRFSCRKFNSWNSLPFMCLLGQG